MSLKTLLDPQVKTHFLNLSRAEVISHLQALQDGLTRYSENPTIVPPRTKVFTPRGDTMHMFMPVVDDVYCGVKTLGYNANSRVGFVGAINVLEPTTGLIQGVVDAKQVTGIRTALSSHIGLYKVKHKFDNIAKLNVTVFGTGLQAFWHSFVCSKLFSEKEIELNVVYRSSLLDEADLLGSCNNVKNINYVKSDSEEVAGICNSSHVIFGTVPTSSPSIFKKFFQESSDIPFTYIGLIGSYQPHMHECDTELVSLFQKEDAKIIVDSKEHTLLEAGELITAKVEPSQLIEIGQLESVSSVKTEVLVGSRSITLSKIVGLAIMDIVTAKKIIEDHH
ncbi:uncharacterized protein KLLA0_F22968g [Kluyveromyces lactis]|uniref:KLLA0F22968p n=1 Tax=Kluyveromyces lactis (strain ATCC 8585 / CBS 2359 / DSM 70799 / NBRC 1267 / NRRL Y-1140 / WM37) TaxID=284590 RepID=Q6CIY5_KLULA|nr:uncharacterized protein KLLA0_F22968g [Kluyveromyces lactis]CAG98812.1 KLLA0F22968p [Kluyveromyces lactis]|eukprot:XP_456104.1 uncharacterized protein KLLA0_F22968g [Kluyveromyces lactis]